MKHNSDKMTIALRASQLYNKPNVGGRYIAMIL
jgi:hypothetical protein